MDSKLTLPDIADMSLELFMRSMGEIVIPNMRDNAILAKAAVVAEIDEQNLIDTGRFRASIESRVDLHNLDKMEIEVWSEAKSDTGYPYPIVLEYGSSRVSPRAPFRKSILRMERVLS